MQHRSISNEVHKAKQQWRGPIIIKYKGCNETRRRGAIAQNAPVWLRACAQPLVLNRWFLLFFRIGPLHLPEPYREPSTDASSVPAPAFVAASPASGGTFPPAHRSYRARRLRPLDPLTPGPAISAGCRLPLRRDSSILQRRAQPRAADCRSGSSILQRRAQLLASGSRSGSLISFSTPDPAASYHYIGEW